MNQKKRQGLPAKIPQKSRKNHQNPANPEMTDSRSFDILQMLWVYHKFRPWMAQS